MGFKGQIFLVAMRDIKPGEEATFDYGTVLHESPDAPRYTLGCKCGASSCRGTITENDWKNPVLQKKYKGYFQYYLAEKISNNDQS